MTDEEYYEFIQPYEDAKQMLLTRLDVLNHNLYGDASARPIHNIQCRIKKKQSIEEKLQRKGKEPTVMNAKDYLQDIAGVRVICYFVDEIFNLAELLEILIPFPIAASVYGLVIMLVGLITKLIPLEKVETAADFLVDAMSIMFVPATVGIMASVNALKEMLLPICVITVVSTVLIMIVTGRVSQHIIRGQKNKGAAAMQTVGTKAAADDKEDR